VNKLQFYSLMFMPYPFIPPAEGLPSTWVNLPNTLYDPKIGHRLYNEYLELNVLTEKLGYDGVLVNEHHQTAYGTMPSPNIMASYIVAKTERINVGVIGNALPLHGNPMRVAEEIAMLDVISGGRIISGFVRGTGNEYHSYGIDPSTSRDRFWEAHDLIMKAWTEPGPFAWDGKYFHLPYVNPWPQPLQKPHPPIWLPGFASLETIDEAAKRHYTFMQVFSPRSVLKRALDTYRRLAEEKYDYEVKREQLGAAILIYVAETDEQAHREARPHITWLFREGLKHPNYFAGPAGYQSQASFKAFLGTIIEKGIPDIYDLTYEFLLEHGYAIVGSPDTVIEQLTKLTDELGTGVVTGAGGQWGAMPHWMAIKNMTLMAEEVMPHFREPDGKPMWAKEERLGKHTLTEHAAVVGKPAIDPSIPWGENGGRIDPRIAHLPELVDEAMARQELETH
jgi:alkanesulfonate monooxygenase SsuD/methylene tetrahydromethanopterin reductase-like flavin-dependent oxidoreductase (luciferase family)